MVFLAVTGGVFHCVMPQKDAKPEAGVKYRCLVAIFLIFATPAPFPIRLSLSVAKVSRRMDHLCDKFCDRPSHAHRIRPRLD